MEKEFSKATSSFLGVEDEWTTWTDTIAPQTDNAAEYCRNHPLEIPFWNELFSGSPINTQEYINPHIPNTRDCPEYETCNSLVWQNRGEKSIKNKYIFIYLTNYIPTSSDGGQAAHQGGR